jgi:hypothetical protein
MKHFLLYYDVCSDYMARRGAYRDVHLTKCWAAHERGELLLGGALENPADGGFFSFRESRPGWPSRSPKQIHTCSMGWSPAGVRRNG